ncbi:MAG: Asp-tRNA(Asn)/Glu-tRNA(Gln) amidotransferase subunit GatB [Anaerolineae bacterium]|uniref:Asp-tRNA(Asn)/Glu-tRNA(Gln) amidotransferase subunit GatB n=1 Tax=Candidatus Amarolinea dominans TaxID=3140696 RepID=UPI001E009173|nr:Asp-tRNA(Asn)/Glu-tRNA(Gln) amidotransferase subunit GatB [Anaerolineae bacterium]MBK7203856.1 Asp-tRNA(Asn)/Glu-tRNA(Gln) amidotransferase subunit GatB [Anaerolineae bacterium]MBK9091644.1 Asp-tRNA(Asn)/Glu-tRNA(Gln) amidotransferase subunit GatB [Anaerolineae bacterium]MBK9230271.1 Asp-tRNA(Asn)/Glu-tRNA(Gln) amidotransferase subunit GatB [Anaerolineae bacterium]
MTMTQYQVVIGMEVHAQLQTASKMFCACDAAVFGAPPNSHVCPVCLGMPGVLPVINRRAVEQTIRTGLALAAEIAETAVFARKNYNYPDLPKGYQISQYELPLCLGGSLTITGDDGRPKVIRVRRAHLEEDTGKSKHMNQNGVTYSLLDYNRSGMPLLEIVTEADLNSAQEAYDYLTKLRTILRYIGASSGDMEKGAMRCEANVSVRTLLQAAQGEYGVKVEIKNLNSFSAVRGAVEYEVKRHIETIERGGTLQQVTLGWNEAEGRTFVQRSKESAHDYRYFPEPDLPPLRITRELVEQLRATLPELPDAKQARFMAQYGLNLNDAATLVATQAVAAYFEATVAAYGGAGREVCNWITGPLFSAMSSANQDIRSLKVTPDNLAALLTLLDRGIINRNIGQRVIATMLETGQAAADIVETEGLAQVSDSDALHAIVREVIVANPTEATKYRAGNLNLLNFLIGQVMRATRGKANQTVVRQLLEQALAE